METFPGKMKREIIPKKLMFDIFVRKKYEKIYIYKKKARVGGGSRTERGRMGRTERER